MKEASPALTATADLERMVQELKTSSERLERTSRELELEREAVGQLSFVLGSKSNKERERK